MSKYNAIIILTKSVTKTRPGQNLAITHTQDAVEQQIYFTNKSHRLRLYIKDFPEREEAQNYAQDISDKTGFPIEKFNPVVSESSRRRR